MADVATRSSSGGSRSRRRPASAVAALPRWGLEAWIEATKHLVEQGISTPSRPDAPRQEEPQRCVVGERGEVRSEGRVERSVDLHQRVPQQRSCRGVVLRVTDVVHVPELLARAASLAVDHREQVPGTLVQQRQRCRSGHLGAPQQIAEQSLLVEPVAAGVRAVEVIAQRRAADVVVDRRGADRVRSGHRLELVPERRRCAPSSAAAGSTAPAEDPRACRALVQGYARHVEERDAASGPLDRIPERRELRVAPRGQLVGLGVHEGCPPAAVRADARTGRQRGPVGRGEQVVADDVDHRALVEEPREVGAATIARKGSNERHVAAVERHDRELRGGARHVRSP